MSWDDQFEQELEWQREDHYARIDSCVDCGSKEICFRERAAEKARIRAARGQEKKDA